LATRETLLEIRKYVEDCLGQKVQLKTNKGKRKVKIREGIIDDVFPSVFTVRIDEGLNIGQTLSFSYSDILTETVEITLCRDEVKIEVS
jgi:uncharacterized protein Veg